MKTLTDLAMTPGISLPEERIVFIGPPSALSTILVLENSTQTHLQIGLLPLGLTKLGRPYRLSVDSIQINAEFTPGQRREKRVKVMIDELTPPGTYDMEATIGGIRKPIRLIVQPLVQIEIHPSQLHFVGITPGASHQGEVLCGNKGNVPLVIPVIEEPPELNADDICKLLGQAISQTTTKNASELLRTFAHHIKQERSSALRRSLKESGLTLESGETMSLHFAFTLPAHVARKHQYEGEIKLFNQKLLYRVVQEPRERARRGGSTTFGMSTTEKED